MYVLYYFEEDYDYTKFEIVAVSKEESLLQAMRDELLEEAAKELEKYEAFQQAMKDHTANAQKSVREFLERNRHAIKKTSEQKKNYWHASSNAYADTAIPISEPTEKEQNATIDEVADRRYFMFLQTDGAGYPAHELEKYLHLGRLKEPLLEMERFHGDTSHIDFNKMKRPECLFVKPVKEIP